MVPYEGRYNILCVVVLALVLLVLLTMKYHDNIGSLVYIDSQFFYQTLREITEIKETSRLKGCDWYQYNERKEILWPRGNPCCSKQDYIQKINELNAKYHALNETYALTSGSLLHAIVGGDWSQDNDLDFVQNKEWLTTDSLCICIYDNITALCQKSGFESTLKYIGTTWWIPLPLAKAVNFRPPGAWYALYHDISNKEWNSYGKVFSHWGNVWRTWAIKAVQVYDHNKDGNIDFAEFWEILQTKVNKEWLEHFIKTRPCDVLSGYLDLKILNEILPEIEKNAKSKNISMAEKGYEIVDKYKKLYYPKSENNTKCAQYLYLYNKDYDKHAVTHNDIV